MFRYDGRTRVNAARSEVNAIAIYQAPSSVDSRGWLSRMEKDVDVDVDEVELSRGDVGDDVDSSLLAVVWWQLAKG